MRIGVDWGGTKTEFIALDENGDELLRERVATPPNYDASIECVHQHITRIESETGAVGSVGIGIPGTISPATELVKNANSTWLNGKPLKRDLEAILHREVRIQNDANCFAVSEAVDGAGAGHHVVAGLILGTGCGCGIAIDGKALVGRQAIAGEFGHVPLPWMRKDEFPGPFCWCGKYGCLETWISGTAFQKDYKARSGDAELISGDVILAKDTELSKQCYADYCDRLARGCALLINIIDPDIIVMGGGMSNITTLGSDTEALLSNYVFSDKVNTKIVQAHHGDSSGVRGAAWLW